MSSPFDDQIKQLERVVQFHENKANDARKQLRDALKLRDAYFSRLDGGDQNRMEEAFVE